MVALVLLSSHVFYNIILYILHVHHPGPAFRLPPRRFPFASSRQGIMICNNSGQVDAAWAARWGMVDIDWNSDRVDWSRYHIYGLRHYSDYSHASLTPTRVPHDVVYLVLMLRIILNCFINRIVLGRFSHFSRTSQLCTTTHMPCDVLCELPALFGRCLVLAIQRCAQFTSLDLGFVHVTRPKPSSQSTQPPSPGCTATASRRCPG